MASSVRGLKPGVHALAISLVAPIVVFLAVVMTRLGVIGVDVGLGLLTLRIGLTLAVGALVATLLATVMNRGRGARALSLLAVGVAVLTLGVFLYQQRQLAAPSALDVGTNASDPPVFSQPIQVAENPEGVTTAGCAGLASIPSQVAPTLATAALKQTGFTVTQAQLFRAQGAREGFWFGRRHEAVIRIRPGQTDVRVVARDGRADGGATCRLARRLVTALQAGS